MTTSTIRAIEDLLLQEKERRTENYEELESEYKEKYKTEWFDKYLTDEEKRHLYDARKSKMRFIEAYEDFESHQWF